jgi:agmatinase
MHHMPFQYGKTRNFCGIPNYQDQPFVVVGAPIDCATTFRSGTRMGPNAIRDASMMLTDGVNDAYPVSISDLVGDAGDMPLPSGYTPHAMMTVKETANGFRNKHLVTLGGHHGITYHLLEVLSRDHGLGNIAVVHFDAHCDTWVDHFGKGQGHGTWLNHAVDDRVIDPTKVISIGIRSPADEAAKNFLSQHGGTTISARSAMRHSPKMMSDVIRAKVGDGPCYLSLDIDCLDPAYAPGTGTPEIGGLTTMWLMEVLENLQFVNWIGMDCVEVSPPYDHSQITSLAAATLVWQYLSMNVATYHKFGSYGQ